MSYPNTPGWKEETTSRDAAKKVEKKAETLRHSCLLVLMRHSLTADECAAYLKESVLSIRPRISELFERGLIKRTGEKRLNESGNRAHVYKAVKQETAKQEDLFRRAA